MHCNTRLHPDVSSRWANETEERPARKAASTTREPVQGQGSSKRAKPGPALTPDDDYNGLTAGLDGFFGKTQGHRGMRDNAKSTRGVLKKVMPAFPLGPPRPLHVLQCLVHCIQVGMAMDNMTCACHSLCMGYGSARVDGSLAEHAMCVS